MCKQATIRSISSTQLIQRNGGMDLGACNYIQVLAIGWIYVEADEVVAS